jgi:hypothetical protein
MPQPWPRFGDNVSDLNDMKVRPAEPMSDPAGWRRRG